MTNTMLTQEARRRQPNHADRAACWRPESWHVDRISIQHYLLSNLVAPVEFEVWDHHDGGYTVRGHSGTLHTLRLGCCCCKGKEQALKEARYCPHEAAVAAVERVKDGDYDPFGGEHDLDGRDATPEEAEALRRELLEEFAPTEAEKAAAEADRWAAVRRTEAELNSMFAGCE
jgi:hypothetical protein